MVIVGTLSTRQIRLYAPIVYGLSCLGLLAVLTPLGSIVNGARAWISIGAGFQVEPSEFAKLSVIVISAMLPSGLRSGERPAARAIARTPRLVSLPFLR